MNKLFNQIIIASLLIIVACAKVPDEPLPIDLDVKSKKLVAADNEFGIDLFKALNEKEKGNFNISPLSISLALAMTYNGSEGDTKQAMEEAMRLSGLTTEEINLSYQTLVKALLETDSKVTLEFAQSIWYRLGYDVEDAFKDVNRNYYDAEVNELDFGRSDAKDIINGWIEEKTHDKIKDMIAEVKPNHVMFLINAIYFNGEWQTMFDKKNTFESDFYTAEGTVQVQMMQKEDSIMMTSNDVFSAIELPYGRGNFNMLILLPAEDKTCDDIVNEINPDNWILWQQSMVPTTEVDIWLPKFKSEYTVKLNNALSAMGMEVAFTPAADFSGINGRGELWIDYVQHNTFIDVSEKGTEAAAATVVAMIERAMPMTPQFHANRPFIYAITEKETGAILFIGKMAKPEYD